MQTDIYVCWTIDCEATKKALDHMDELTTFTRVLGCYGEGRVVDGSSVLKRSSTHGIGQ